METLKTVIEVEIKDVDVEDGYYSFKYRLTVDGKKRKWESYDSDFDGYSDKQWEKILKESYALECALRDFEV